MRGHHLSPFELPEGGRLGRSDPSGESKLLVPCHRRAPPARCRGGLSPRLRAATRSCRDGWTDWSGVARGRYAGMDAINLL
ncbi:hypothetical protein AZA_87642 [Nitrospirillum viridazoti Y2]|nr:hypothetical protein AZA_87642 [Nitrospirillum amazonense Y2]